MDAVRARGARDARGHRIPDPQRDLAVASEERPALSRPVGVHRPGQLRHRPVLEPVVDRRVAHRRADGDLGGDRARARHAARAGDAPRDLRSRPDPHVRADPLRDRHGRGRVRLAPGVLRRRRRLHARSPAFRRTARSRDRPPRADLDVLDLRRGDPRRGVEDDAVHGPPAAGGPRAGLRRAARGGQGRRRDDLAALLADHDPADEARDPRGAPVPHPGRLPDLRHRLRLVEQRLQPLRGDGVGPGLQHAAQPAQPRLGLGGLRADLPVRRADRRHVRQGARHQPGPAAGE